MGSKSTSLSTAIRLKNKGMTDLSKVKNTELLPLFSRVQVIQLQHNKLSMIPYNICVDLQRSPRIIEFLEELNLGYNKFSRIPDVLFTLVNLKILNLEHNLITDVPQEISNFYRLEQLFLNHNRIKHLPWQMHRLKQLRVLCIDENNIDYIPNTVGKLEHLVFLQVIPNDLGTIDDEEVLLACFSGRIEIVMKFLLKQIIPQDYPFWEDINADEERKRKKRLEYTDDQNLLRKLLKSENGYNAMEAYMIKEHSAENIYFWKAIRQYAFVYCSLTVPITTGELVESAKQIFNTFIAEESKYTVNLPAEVTAELRRVFKDTFVFPKGIDQFVFKAAYKAILDLISRDTFRRFKTTPEGMEIIQHVQQSTNRKKIRLFRGVVH